MSGKLWIVLCGIIALAASQEQCAISISKEDFRSYVGGFSQCDIGAGRTTLQDEVEIVNQVFDLDGSFDIDGLDITVIEDFCGSVAGCKGSITACESDLQTFVDTAGMALCQNGMAVTREIQEAADTLAKQNCNVDFDPAGIPPSDGCYIGRDIGNPPTYLRYITRENKIRSAESRCYYRFLEAENICTPTSIAALATIYAASKRLENIGRTFSSYTTYQKPALSTDSTTMAFRGFSHLYMDGVRHSTCRSLSGSDIFLWNTYIRIDGTTSGLNPVSEKMLLTNILIQFSNAAGQTLDSYSTTTTEKSLQHQTMRQQAGQKTKIELDISRDVVTLTHPELDMKIVIGTDGQALSILVNMPTSMYELETVGVLVDGCVTFGGESSSDLGTLVSSDCRSNCSTVKVPSKHVDECAYDCTNGLRNYTGLYSEISRHTQSSMRDITSGAVPKSLLDSIMVLLGSLLLLVGTLH